MKNRYLLVLVLIFISQYLNAQIKDIGILPFIKNYTTKQYNAAQQNWAAIQDTRGIMYFANSEGAVLQFDGKTWNKIKVEKGAVRSFAMDNQGVIYVGATTELGYLAPNPAGQLTFNSLKNKLPEDFQNGYKKVWDIFFRLVR